MKYFIFYVLWIGSAAIVVDLCRIEIRRRSPFVSVWASIIAVIIIPSFWDPFTPIVYPHPFSPAVYLNGDNLVSTNAIVFTMLLLFRAFYAAFDSLYKKNKMPKIKDYAGGRCSVQEVLYVTLIASSGVALSEIYSKYGLSFFSGFGFEERREGLSALSGFLLSYNFMIAAGLGCWFTVRRRYIALVLLLSLYLAFYVVLGGSRQPVLAVIVPIVVWWVMDQKRPLLRLILILLGSGLILGVFDWFLYFRNLSGFSERMDALVDFSGTFAKIRENDRGEHMLRFAMYYFVENGEKLSGFFEFDYMKRLALLWMPSQLDVFSIKPPDFEYTMFYHFMHGREGTMHPTIFGSIYADSGPAFLLWVGVLAFILYFFPNFLSRLRGLAYVSTWSTFAFYGLMIARGAFYGPLLVMVVALVFANIVTVAGRLSLRRISVL